MTFLIAELVEKLKLYNKGNSLNETKTKVKSSKNSENKLEDAIALLLELAGYTKTEDADPKPNCFVVQPYGSQNPPDLLVKDINNDILLIEAKSGKTIMFNSGIPKKEYYYMCEYLNGTAYRGYGKDIFNPLIFTLMPQIRKEFDGHNKNPINRLKSRFTEQEIAFIEATNLCIYPRAMTQGIPSNSQVWLKNQVGT